MSTNAQHAQPRHGSARRRIASGDRGSILILALLLVAIVGISIATYLDMGANMLKMSHRTFFADNAGNLAEAGLEQAIWSFNQLGAGASTSAAWGTIDSQGTAWTCNSTTDTATLVMPTFNLDQNATCVVKVYVEGYSGSSGTATVVAQATITPFDGSNPIVKIEMVTLKFGGKWAYGMVAQNDISWNGHPSADSFISTTNPSSGPYSSYPASVSRSNTTVASSGGDIDLGAQGTVYGNVLLGTGSVSGGTITGTTTTGFSYDFTPPSYPTAASVSQSYDLGSSVPSSLPRSSDNPASDGCYYYFVSGATISGVTIQSGDDVAIVGSGDTSVSSSGSGESESEHGNSHSGSDDSEGGSSCSGITIQPSGNLSLYIDGPVSVSGNGFINNESWAGALQIFTTTTAACSIGGNGSIYACLFCPNAALTCNGGGNSGMLVGSFVANSITSNGHMDFHYDEALKNVSTGNPWSVSQWRELQSASDRATYASAFSGF